MTVNKITTPPTKDEVVDKINEVIDNLGGGGVAPVLDNITVSKNSNDELQVIGVIDDNSGNAIKTWTGTRTQYNALATKDNNTLYWVTDAKIIYLGETPVGNFSGGRNVGEIIQSSLPLTDAGLHLLDGTRLSGDGIYGEFVQYIADLYNENPTANYFTDETSWQSSVTQYGVCGKFVYDSTLNTVRLPKVTGKIDGTTDINALGDLAPLFVRLPNITATWTSDNRPESAYHASGTGAVKTATRVTWGIAGGGAGDYSWNLSFDASRSSSVYSGNDSNMTIHEQAVKMFVYIVIATSTKTDIQVDIDEIATDLNGKADVDLTNVTDTGYIKMAGAGMPSNRYINLTLNASGSTYTAPADGWFTISKEATSSGQYVNLVNQNCLIAQEIRLYGSGGINVYIPCKKNDIIKCNYTASGTTNRFRFIYAQGSESEAQ